MLTISDGGGRFLHSAGDKVDASDTESTLKAGWSRLAVDAFLSTPTYLAGGMCKKTGNATIVN